MQVSRVVEYMRGPGLQSSFDDSNAVTLSKFTYGTDSIFGLLEQDDERKTAFDEYMVITKQRNPRAWFELYPMEEKLRCMDCHPNHPLIVDIGGGIGHILEQFKQRYPDHPGRLILQDLPSTLERSERLPEGVEAMGYDFFTPQPVGGMLPLFWIYVITDTSHRCLDLHSSSCSA